MPMSPRIIILIVLLLAVFTSGGTLLSLYIDALWFQEVGYLSVFTTRLTTQLVLGALVGAVMFAWLGGNVLWAARRRLTLLPPPWSAMLANRSIRPLLIGAALIVGVIQGLQAAAQWQAFLLFRHPTAFGQADPLFGLDLGFYVFTLPFLSTIKGWLLMATGLAIAASGLLYVANQEIRLDPARVVVTPAARRHLFGLGALAALIVGWGYRLDQYQLLYSRRGVVFGAVYADIHARLPATRRWARGTCRAKRVICPALRGCRASPPPKRPGQTTCGRWSEARRRGWPAWRRARTAPSPKGRSEAYPV